MRAYQELVRKILWEGTRKENRTGVDTLSTFAAHYTHDMRRGFPLLTTKEMSWKNIVVEFAWFLTGGTNVSFLHRHSVHFWDAWADAAGEVPVGYGAMWRAFPDVVGEHGAGAASTPTDQLSWLVGELRRNPLSRRLVMSHWSPRLCHAAKLPPCPVTLVFNVQESTCDHPVSLDSMPPHCAGCGANLVTCPPPSPTRTLNLHVTQRSADVALGVPYDLASYALLLSVVSALSGIRAGTFSHLLVDAHAYTAKPDGSKAEYDHVPGLKEQLQREPRRLPTLHLGEKWETVALDDLTAWVKVASTEELLGLFELRGYDPHPAIKFKVAV